MPSSSERQRRFFGMALAYKRGKLKYAGKRIREVASAMSENQLKDFARKPEE